MTWRRSFHVDGIVIGRGAFWRREKRREEGRKVGMVGEDIYWYNERKW